MNRLLPVLTIILLLLIVVDRLGHVVSAALVTTTSAPASHPAAPHPSRTAAAAAHAADSADVEDTSSAGATPTIDRLARLATRQQLAREAGETYIDSLILSTDSVVRRWPDRSGPLRIAIIEGGPREWTPQMADYVRDAMSRWEGAGLGVRFEEVHDTTDADITVHWIDRFAFDRAGQTDLTWDQLGRVRHASVALAVHTSVGLPIPESALLAVAVHETGHALGLPHSADSTDVMFPATRTGTLSDRDRRTALLLYRLAPGPIRDIGTR
jgi:predicted Zn-dependent protease